jgi:hypothetical protein
MNGLLFRRYVDASGEVVVLVSLVESGRSRGVSGYRYMLSSVISPLAMDMLAAYTTRFYYC